MTAASYRRHLESVSHPQHDPAPSPPRPVSSYRGRLRFAIAVMAFACCELLGMAAVVHSYVIAQSTLSSSSEFAWFWAGMLLIELPIAGLLARQGTPLPMRGALLAFYGLVSYAPKLLRNPTSPIYHDEFAHWRATYDILNTGKLFQPDPIISIVSEYPGLHATTAAVVHATGLSIWQSAVLLLILLHVTLVLGIAALAQSLGLTDRTASLIAILYCLNSSFLYFDTQFAYESMAITLVVWALVAYVRAIRSQSGQGRLGWGVLTVALAAGTVVTHHLSTFMLILIMALAALAVSVPRLARADGWARTATTAWGLTLVSALIAGAWFRFAAPSTLSYLSPFLGQGVSQLAQDLRGSGTARQLFGATLSPWWEERAAFLVPAIALGFAVAGLFMVRVRIRAGHLRRGPRRALLLAFTLLGLVYFPSTVFILSPSGAEGARRSWAFTWIGLSILAGLAAVWVLDWAGDRMRLWSRVSLRSGLLAVLAIALIGGTAAGLDAAYRFPGPYLFGSDARSITPELLAASEWFSTRFGTSNNVVTDRNTGLVFGSFGLQDPATPSAGFPVYNLYLAKPGAPIEPPFLLFEMSNARYTYLIVDSHMAYEVPETGVYFEPNEPTFLTKAGKSIFNGRLDKFNTMTWMVKVFQSDNYSVYRLNLPVSKIVYQHQAPKLPSNSGKLSVTP